MEISNATAFLLEQIEAHGIEMDMNAGILKQGYVQVIRYLNKEYVTGSQWENNYLIALDNQNKPYFTENIEHWPYIQAVKTMSFKVL